MEKYLSGKGSTKERNEMEGGGWDFHLGMVKPMATLTVSPLYLNTKSTWFGRLVSGLIDRFGLQQMALKSFAEFVYAKRCGID